MSGGSTPAARAAAVHFICVVGLAAGGWIARNVCSSGLVSEPARVLRLLVLIESPVVIIAYSLVRSDKERTSFIKAVGRGVLGLPLGALLNAFGAIVLGAPFWIEYLKRTINWSLLMSLFTFVPAVCVFGYSRKDWPRILALAKNGHTITVSVLRCIPCQRMASVLDYMVSLPAHGAVIGAWFGAWPMPLDWERPWQEWPICVTYGAVLGYVVGVLASLLFILCQKVHKKED